jgi:hypothetical protein
MHILGSEVQIRGTDPLILNLGTKCKGVANFMCLLLCPEGRTSYPLKTARLGVPVSVWTLWRRGKPLPLPTFELQFVRPISYSVYQLRSLGSSQVWYTEDNIKSKNDMLLTSNMKGIKIIQFARKAFSSDWLLGIDTGRDHYLLQTIRRNYLPQSSEW